MELVIILLVGQACGMVEFYTAEMPNMIVGCSNFQTLNETMDYWKPFIEKTDYQIVYVVDSMGEVPRPVDGRELSLGGLARPSEDYAVAYRYVWVILHEAAHLLCECDHGPVFELYVQRLTV